jgi:hypothetical protein
MSTSEPRTSAPQLIRSPRLWSIILTIVGTLLMLVFIWDVIALDPDELIYQIRGSNPVQIGTWLAVAGLATYGVFAAVRYVTSTLVASFAGRRKAIEPVLGLAAYTLLVAGVLTGHLFECGVIALVLALATRMIVQNIRSAPVSAV